MTAAATKAPRERLTLRDSIDLEIAVDQWIDAHVDEIELNGGALPDDLAQLLDEVLAAQKNRVDAIAAKLDDLGSKAAAAKATKDRAARRETVWKNVAAAIKAYALRELERRGVTRLEGTSAVIRRQNNSAPSVECCFDDEQLLAFFDVGAQSPLAEFITLTRVPHLDRKAIAAAYEARRAGLEDETSLLGESDIADRDLARIAEFTANVPNASRADAVAAVLVDMRARYIADNLAAEFPGITCTRSSHLRVD